MTERILKIQFEAPSHHGSEMCIRDRHHSSSESELIKVTGNARKGTFVFREDLIRRPKNIT